MSYNIDTTRVIRNTLRLPERNFLDMWDLLESKDMNLPESNFMEPFLDYIDKWPKRNGEVPPRAFKIENLDWYGAISGTSLNDGMMSRIVALLEGEADFLFIWEGGDTISGHVVRDGKMYDVEHQYKLIIPEHLKSKEPT